MPTYEYECKSCGHTFEAFQAMSDAPLKECPQCGKEIRRLIFGGAGVIFKGSGFYVTDKGKGAATNTAAKTSKTAEAASSAAADGAPPKSDAPKDGPSSGGAEKGVPQKSEAAGSSFSGGSSESKEKAAAPKSA